MLEMGETLLIEINFIQRQDRYDFLDSLEDSKINNSIVYESMEDDGKMSLILSIENTRKNDKMFLSSLLAIFEDYSNLNPRFISAKEV